MWKTCLWFLGAAMTAFIGYASAAATSSDSHWYLTVLLVLSIVAAAGFVVTGCIYIVQYVRKVKPSPKRQVAKTSPSQLSNRKELISAIHQVKETANEAITTSNMLSQLHKTGEEPPQRFVTNFANAFDRYQEALKGLEREALIAGEAFHEPINSFFAKVNSCVQNPVGPVTQPGSTVALVNPAENTNKLNDAMNEVVKEIDRINQSTPEAKGSEK